VAGSLVAVQHHSSAPAASGPSAPPVDNVAYVRQPVAAAPEIGSTDMANELSRS
jgi:hypothetical protein